MSGNVIPEHGSGEITEGRRKRLVSVKQIKQRSRPRMECSTLSLSGARNADLAHFKLV